MDENSPVIPREERNVVEGAFITINNHETPAPSILLTPDGDELSMLFGPPPPTPSALSSLEQPPPTNSAAPEFDPYLAVVKLLIGGTIEGATELIKRLERWDSELQATHGAPGAGEIPSNSDVARYLLVGMALSTSDGLRRQAIKAIEASDVFWRLTGTAAQPLVKNRLTGIVAGPIDRAIDRLVARGQKRVSDWVELGRAHEPGARQLARKSYLGIVDEFISHLAENEELADLVQEQSVGLASEAVDEIRSRTVSADALAEGIVRRILRRAPRRELPSPPEGILQAISAPAPPAKRP